MISLWWDQLPPDLAAPIGAPLAGDAEADIAIVGAGYTGLWTAYYLQQLDPTLRIAIIEAEVAGFGASGRNGGWASALFPVSLRQLAARSDREGAIRMERTMIATVDEIGRVAEAEGWDIGWSKGGSITLARSALQQQRAVAEVASRTGWGFGPPDTELLTAEQAERILRATSVHGGTYTPHCAAIQPAMLVRQLARTVAARGARLHEHTRATAIEPGRVRTEHGTVRAEVVVRATEGYTRSLAGQRRTLSPVYSLMIATEPLPEQLWEQIGLARRETFADGRHLIIYGQRTADGRIAFGGRGAPYHFGSRITPEQDRNASVHRSLHKALVELLPMIADARITHAWGGPLGIPRDWWASCGFDRATGTAWSGGYVGDGVGTSNLGGRTLADLICGRDTDLVSLPWVGHRSPKWEPEPLRWLGTTMGQRVVASADAKEQRTGRPSALAAAFERLTGH